MITNDKIENCRSYKENNNRFYKYMKNKRSMRETVVSVRDCEGKSVTDEGKLKTARKLNISFPSTCLPEGRRQKQRSVLEVESEKLMKQKLIAEQVKKKKKKIGQLNSRF